MLISALLLVGLVVAAVGGFWLLVAAFKESIGWGLGCLFVPFVSLVFVVMKWDRAKNPFFVQLAGTALVMIAFVMAPELVTAPGEAELG